jgi:hypothetical protein
MHISFSPIRHEGRLTLHKSGDALRINGETFDFSEIPEGATLPREAVACPWLVSDIERIDGRLHLTLLLPHGPDALRQTLFPAPLVATDDGDLPVPPHGSSVQIHIAPTPDQEASS